jgi:hypothetical protein
MTTIERWRDYMTNPRMRDTARRKKLNAVFPILHEWYQIAHPEQERSTKIVLDAVNASYREGGSYAEWAAAARSRLQLDFIEPTDTLKVRVVKLGSPSLGNPTLEERV